MIITKMVVMIRKIITKFILAAVIKPWLWYQYWHRPKNYDQTEIGKIK